MAKATYENVVRAKTSTPDRLRAVWRYRELLAGMIRKDLKVKYKNSVLGFLWTMVNPALYLLVFWLVFTKFLNNGIPEFVIFFLAGLLVWNLFSSALAGSTGSVVGHAAIIKKVYFPREILPLASVGSAVVHYLLQLVVLLIALVVFQHNIDWSYVWLLPLSLVTVVLFATSLGILLSAVNVYARDTEHLLELGLLAWFWTTPVVYQYALLENANDLVFAVFSRNPMTLLIIPFQRVIYGEPSAVSTVTGQEIPLVPDESMWWYFQGIAMVFVISVFLFWIAMRVFDRAQGNFAEEL
jgi:ABC-2 type transport system permease protein